MREEEEEEAVARGAACGAPRRETRRCEDAGAGGAAEEVRFGALVVGPDLGAAHRADERGVAREEARARGLAERVDRLEAADGVAEVRVDGPMAVEQRWQWCRTSEEGSRSPLG